MPYRDRNLGINQYYHIYNRGVDKQTVFFTREHFSICLRLIQKYVRIYSVEMLAWCLMPNHFHFLLRTEQENSLSLFMQTLFNAYVQSLNKNLSRKGPLFESRFKHILVDRTEYLKQLCRYIHMNPVRAGLVAAPFEWLYSDYLEWTGKIQAEYRKAQRILEYFGGFDEYGLFIRDKLNDGPELLPEKYFLE